MWFGYAPNPKSTIDDKKENPRYAKLTEKELSRIRREFIFKASPVFEPVSRQDVVGIDHIVKELEVYIKLIQNFESLDAQKAELDTGLIFIGKPGSGKTFCARFLVTESKARFIDITEFPRQKARFTAGDIVELFSLMKRFVFEEKKPIIAFWDEFETFTDVGEDSEKIQALSSFKTELSGIKGGLRGIFIIVATNRPNLIPSDVARPGRLGKIIHFNALSRRAKELVLKHFISQYNHDPDIDFKSLSFLISAELPVDIEVMVKDAWRYSIMENIGSDKKGCLTNELLVRTLIKQGRGIPNDIVLTDEEMNAIAIYEVGRAIITRTLKYNAQLIVLDREGYPDAYRISENENRSACYPLEKIRDEVAIRYGGIIAQEICEIKPNTKQINDFMQSTSTAQRYVESLRVNEMSTEVSITALAQARSDQSLPVSVGIVEKTMYDTKEAINNLLKDEQKRVKTIFKHYGREFIEKLAQELIKKGYMLQIDIDATLDKDFTPPPDSSKNKKTKRKLGF